MLGGESRDVALAAVATLVDVDRAEEFIALLDDDVRWVIPGAWPGISGVKDRASIERFVRRSFPAGFPKGIEADIQHVHTVGDTTVVEFVGRAVTSKDREYVNDYCFVFVVRSGRVVRIREYMDTLYADGVLHK